MLEVWLPLLVIGALGAWWYHVLRLREQIIVQARRLCDVHGLQLLDDSVALHRLRLRRHGRGWVVQREYRFDTSTGGDDRRTASLTLVDGRITGSSLPTAVDEPLPPAAPRPVYPPAGDNNVIPITRSRRTLN